MEVARAHARLLASWEEGRTHHCFLGKEIGVPGVVDECRTGLGVLPGRLGLPMVLLNIDCLMWFRKANASPVTWRLETQG